MFDLPDFKAMPKGVRRAFWFCVGRIKHCPLWCSWCRTWGPWDPIKGKPDCHADENCQPVGRTRRFLWRIRYSFYGWHVTSWDIGMWWAWSSAYDDTVYLHEMPSEMVFEEISACQS